VEQVETTGRLKLILASASPRRRELLASLGVEFAVVAGAKLDERAFLAEQTGSAAERLKALALAKGEPVMRQQPDAVVLSADTEVVLDGVFLGKPTDEAAAVDMLRRLSGRTHEVITAVAMRQHSADLAEAAAVVTQVTFAELSDERIAQYVALAQPYDYAGSYAMQGLGSLLITRIDGDTSNVIGLPLAATMGLLEEAGVLLQGRPSGRPL
jgi:septum formation protein